MNYRMLGYLLGIILLIEAALMALPALVAVIYGESVWPFLVTMAVLVAASAPFVIFKPKDTGIYAREGFVCVGAAWILMSAFGALPFVFSGAIPNYIDAFFETVSGFTTTGATILGAVEGLPRGILFWRSFTHWVGGMGVLVFMLAIMPSDNGRAMYLLRAEVPGPTKDKLVPKMRQSALILYGIYVMLTVIMVIALLCTGMEFYDSLVNSFATAGTGGFSVKNTSIAGYNNPAAEWVVAVFMLIFGVNFNIYFLLLVKKFKSVLKNEELRIYLIICVVATAVISINTLTSIQGLGVAKGIRDAFFQVTTIISTSGFSTTNYDALWPTLSKAILILLTVTGACAGSTAGGMKLSRVALAVKSIFRNIKQMVRPKSVNPVRMDGDIVPDETLRATTSYVTIYFAALIVCALVLSADAINYNFETNVTAALTCLNNVGPGLGAVGPAGNFAAYSWLSKSVLSFLMLFGRLEFMPMLILFSPSSWKRH